MQIIQQKQVKHTRSQFRQTNSGIMSNQRRDANATITVTTGEDIPVPETGKWRKRMRRVGLLIATAAVVAMVREGVAALWQMIRWEVTAAMTNGEEAE